MKRFYPSCLPPIENNINQVPRRRHTPFFSPQSKPSTRPPINGHHNTAPHLYAYITMANQITHFPQVFASQNILEIKSRDKNVAPNGKSPSSVSPSSSQPPPRWRRSASTAPERGQSCSKRDQWSWSQEWSCYSQHRFRAVRRSEEGASPRPHSSPSFSRSPYLL